MTALSIWFWQQMVTPHMAFLAAALAKRGHNVTYVAEQPMDDQRAALGWQAPDLPDVSLRFAATPIEAQALVAAAEAGTVHLTQGFRSNGTIRFAQRAIQARKQRHFVIMETVDQRGAIGFLKPALYAWHLYRWRGLNGVLAIGANTPDWLRRLAPAKLRTFPFAYFLNEFAPPSPTSPSVPFRFLFVGALVRRKRVDLLLQCLGELSEKTFDVEVVGEGPTRERLERLADQVLPGRVTFRGVVPISKAPGHMASADCLILPSDHDGWGAVASEALMTGTPVICSEACGSHEVVMASGAGGVFSTYDTGGLRQLLASALARGKVGYEGRESLRSWARCLGAAEGAAYLEALLLAEQAGMSRFPPPPWQTKLNPDAS